jgi:uncharacterized coiled-coil protein SlyX
MEQKSKIEDLSRQLEVQQAVLKQIRDQYTDLQNKHTTQASSV